MRSCLTEALKDAERGRIPRALYIHSPFCHRRCPYCDFAIAVRRSDRPAERYLDNLDRELERRVHGISVRSLYIGGGTPTALSLSELERFFQILRRHVDFAGCVEFTVEANPEDLDELRVDSLVRGGVTRVSLGAQSFSSDVLRRLGRRHTPDEVRDSVARVRAVGIRQINLDLIFGVPSQTLASLLGDLAAILALAPDHVSAYGLTYESGTAYGRARSWGRLTPVCEDLELEMFRAIRHTLASRGFVHYELSNYARPGARSIHNLTYWRNHPSIGVGPSAVSYVGGIRRKNEPDLESWCARLEAGDDPVADSEELLPLQSLRETVMLALRTRHGVSDRRLRRRYGQGIEALDPLVLRRLERDQLVEVTERGFRLTARGIEVADHVAAALL